MKQIISRYLTAVVLGLVSVVCCAQKTAFYEDFESPSLPDGWRAGSAWTFTEGAARFSTNVLNGTDTLFFPLVDISSLDWHPSLTLAYKLPLLTNVNDTLQVLTEAEDGTFTELALLNLPIADYASVTLDLPANSKQTAKVALVGKSASAGGVYIDYVRIANREECTVAPQFLPFAGLSSNQVILLWSMSTASNFEGYNLKVSTKALDNPSLYEGDVYDGVVYQEEMLLANLTEATTYYVYLQNVCGAEDVSAWADTTFTTLCLPITIPYTEDFENDLSDCSKILLHPSATSADMVAISREYVHEGGAALKMESGAGKVHYLFLPESSDDVSQYQVTFYAATNDESVTKARTVHIGVSATQELMDVEDVKVLTLPKARTWEQITVSLAGYKGVGRYIVIGGGNENSKNLIFIDDIRIEKATACPMPMFLSVLDVTSVSARFYWTEAGNASEWNVVVSETPVTDFDNLNPDDCAFAGVASGVPFEVKGLQPATEYYVYLQSGCSDSEWTDGVAFKTAQAVTFPYVEHFDRYDADFYTNTIDAAPNGWVTGSRGILTIAAASRDLEFPNERPYVSTTANAQVTSYTKASLLIPFTTNRTKYAMMPAMPTDLPLQDMTVEFSVYNASGAGDIIVGVSDVQSSELPQGDMFGAGKNFTPVDTAHYTLKAEWQRLKVNLKNYTGTGKYITFVPSKITATLSPYIDDIEVYPLRDCSSVVKLTAKPLSKTAIEATWTEFGKATAWQVKVSTVPLTDFSAKADTYEATLAEPKLMLDNLHANTTYYVYVRPDGCDVDWVGTSATTLYAMTLPYYTAFNAGVNAAGNTGNGSGYFPEYWMCGNFAGGTGTYIPYVVNTAFSAATGYTVPAEVVKPCLYFGSGTAATSFKPYAILPELEGTAVKDVVLSFWGETQSTTLSGVRTLKIGVMSDPYDVTTLVPVASVSTEAAKIPKFYFVSLKEYTGNGKYIVFYMENTTTSNFYIDNLTVSAFTDPQVITDFSVEPATTGGTFTWKENGVATQWRLNIYDSNVANPDEATPLYTELVSGSPSCTVTTLTHSSRYYAYVQAVGNGKNGQWTNLSFWTDCGEVTLPYYQDFNAFDDGTAAKPSTVICWDVTGSHDAKGVLNNRPYIAKASISVGSSSGYWDHTYGKDDTKRVLRFAVTSKDCVAQIMLPYMPAPLNQLQMTFYMSYYSLSSYVGFLQIGVLTDDEEFIPVMDYTHSSEYIYEEVFVSFASIPDNTKGRICLRADYNYYRDNIMHATSGKSLYPIVDDLLVELIPACGKITTVNVSDVTASSATVAWTKAKDEQAWNIKVSTLPIDPATQDADVLSVLATDMSYQLTNLPVATTFYAYVQAVDAAHDCTGDWSAPVQFTTHCMPIALPFYEDFEDYSVKDTWSCSFTSGDLPGFATITAPTSTTPPSVDGVSAAHLNLLNASTSQSNYLVFPLLDIEDVTKVQLAMSVCPQYNGINYWEVGVMTDPLDPSSFVGMKVDSAIYAGTSQAFLDMGGEPDRKWDRYYYTFENYKGDDWGKQGKYIALHPLDRIGFYSSLDGSPYYSAASICIDNVEVDYVQNCPMLNRFKVKEYSNDTICFTWNTYKKQGATYRLRLFSQLVDNPMEVTPIAEVLSDTTMAVARNLKGNTNYYAYLRMECAEDEFTEWTQAVAIMTACESVQTLPYIESFDAYTTGSMPQCWTNIPRSNSAGQVNCSLSANGENGSKALSVTFSSEGQHSSANSAIAVTPCLDITSWKDITVYFNAKTSTTNASAPGVLYVYAAKGTELYDDKVLIGQRTNLSSANWQCVYINIAQSIADGVLLEESLSDYKYIRFETLTEYSKGKTVYIDNLVITQEHIDEFRMSSLQLNNLGSTFAAYSFMNVDPAITSWTVEYGPKGFEHGAGTVKTLTTTADTLTNLLPATAYDIYVQQTGGTLWTEPLGFTTSPMGATLPYITGFEDADDNAAWVLRNKRNPTASWSSSLMPNSFIFGDAALCDGTGDKALFVSSDGVNYNYRVMSELTIYTTIWALRYLEIPYAGTYTVRVKIKNEGTVDLSDPDNAYIRARLYPATYAFATDVTTAPVSITNNSTAGTYLIFDKFYGQPDFQWIEKSIVINEPGTYMLGFEWYSLYKEPGMPAAIDSVSVVEYQCMDAQDIALTELTAQTAAFKWFAGRNQKFEVAVSTYRKVGDPGNLDEADYIAHDVIDNGPAYRVTGLKPDTRYAFYVRTICDEGDTEWVEYDFLTTCANQTCPYFESFYDVPSCWTLGSARTTTLSYKKSTDDMGDTWPVLLLPLNSIAVLPQFDVPLENLMLNITATQTNTANSTWLTVGVMDNVFDYNSFYEIGKLEIPAKSSLTYSNDYELTKLVLYISEQAAKQGSYIALKGDVQNVIYIDNIEVTEYDCPIPYKVIVSQVSDASALISWLPATLQQTVVRYNGEEIEATSNPYLLTGLSQGTDYTVDVKGVCASASSAWSTPASFTTLCGVNPLPLWNDFSDAPVYANKSQYNQPCWQQMLSKQLPDLAQSQPFAFELTTVTSYHKYHYQWLMYSASSMENWGGNKHIASYLYQDSDSKTRKQYKWLVSPAYQLTADNTFLSYDVAFATLVGKPNTYNGTFYLSVMITTDNGTTWKQLSSIPSDRLTTDWMQYSIDLSDYADQEVKIAFVHDVVYSSSGIATDFHIDNIRLNCVQNYVYTDYACQGVDYEGYNFTVPAEELVLDEPLLLERFAWNTEEGCDSIITLTLQTKSPVETHVEETICDGETFVMDNFSATEAGNYLVRYNSVYGCDSLVYVTLSVNPSLPANEIKRTIYLADLPYTDGIITIPADFGVGTYTDKVLVNDALCQWNLYTIEVRDLNTAVDNLSSELGLYPNPVKAGEILTVNYPFTVAQQTDCRIYIYDAAGALVTTNIPTLFPATLRLPLTDGFYTIRVVTGTGEIFTDKFVVN